MRRGNTGAPVIGALRRSARSIAFQVVPRRSSIVGLVYRGHYNAGAQSRARAHRLRLRLLEQHRRLRHQPDADRLFCEPSTYGRAFLVGLLNTLLVAAIGIVLATVLGFAVGIARLVAQLARGQARRPAMSRSIRNMPLLLQLLFWYNAVLKALPEPARQHGAAGRHLSQQSRPVPAAAEFAAGFGRARRVRSPVGTRRVIVLSRSGRAGARSAPAQQCPVFWSALALLVGLPLVAVRR